jgi:hypothetical protein
VKRGFVDRRKIGLLKVNYLVQGGDQPIFLQGVLSQKIFARPVPTFLF